MNLTQEQRYIRELEIIFYTAISFGMVTTIKAIAKDIHSSAPTVYRDLQELREKGLIEYEPGERRIRSITLQGIYCLRDQGVDVVGMIGDAKIRLNELEASLSQAQYWGAAKIPPGSINVTARAKDRTANRLVVGEPGRGMSFPWPSVPPEEYERLQEAAWQFYGLTEDVAAVRLDAPDNPRLRGVIYPAVMRAMDMRGRIPSVGEVARAVIRAELIPEQEEWFSWFEKVFVEKYELHKIDSEDLRALLEVRE